VPPLLLQPLVENAVTHGIARLIDGGVIRLDISRRNGHLAIMLENPCDADGPAVRPGGMGLDNVRSRLDAMFTAGAPDTRRDWAVPRPAAAAVRNP
jgi:two-component system sensor histidine kinase AlgZ